MVTLDEQPRIGRFEGEFWHVDLDGIRLPRPIRPTLPITLAPLRAAMTEMAAEVADGILGHPVWSPRWITGEMRAAVDRGLARAGRRRGDLRITAWLRVAITDDIEQGRADARVGIPFYASLRQYDSYFEALGLAADARRLQDLAEARRAARRAVGGGLRRDGRRARDDRAAATTWRHGSPPCSTSSTTCASRRRTGCRPSARASTTTAIAAHLLPGAAGR